MMNPSFGDYVPFVDLHGQLGIPNLKWTPNSISKNTIQIQGQNIHKYKFIILKDSIKHFKLF